MDFRETSRNSLSDRFPAPGISRSMTYLGISCLIDASITQNTETGAMDLRSLQKPLKEHYRSDPNASKILIRAKGAQTDVPMACSVDIGRAIYQAEAHQGVGGAGSGACSGDLLLGALAACAQITCQMVAAAMGIPTERIEVTVDGGLDLRGTLGISKDAAVGFESIRVHFDVAAPDATQEQLLSLREKTEQYCVVMQTLMRPPKLETDWVGRD
jgi:uncharacterized OsmC-like protein